MSQTCRPTSAAGALFCAIPNRCRRRRTRNVVQRTLIYLHLKEGVSSAQHPSLSSPSTIAFASSRFYTLLRLFISVSYLMSSLQPNAVLHSFLSICLPFVYLHFSLFQLVSSCFVRGSSSPSASCMTPADHANHF
jgi:hypothetical protein